MEQEIIANTTMGFEVIKEEKHKVVKKNGEIVGYLGRNAEMKEWCHFFQTAGTKSCAMRWFQSEKDALSGLSRWLKGERW